MLKIKDNVDLKELEKYGLKPKYDEDTGEIKGFIKNCHNNFVISDEFYFYNDYFSRYFDEDLLYDLIKDGLVEKVDD